MECCTGVAACSHSLTLYTSVTERPILAAQAYIASGAGKQHAHPTNQTSEPAVVSAPEAVHSTEPRQDIRRNLAENFDDANTRVRNASKKHSGQGLQCAKCLHTTKGLHLTYSIL